MRRVRVLRKIFHVQRDVMFTMVLLLFFCLLLYTQQVSTPFKILRWQGKEKKKYKKNTLFVIIPLNQGFMLLGSAPDGLGQNRVASGDPGLHQLQPGSAGSGEDQNGVRVSSKRQNKHDPTKQ